MSIRLYDNGNKATEEFRNSTRATVRRLVEPLVHTLMELGADQFDLIYMISQQAALAASHKKALMNSGLPSPEGLFYDEVQSERRSDG